MMPKLILLPGLHGTGDLFGPLLAVLPPEIPRRVFEHPTDRACSMSELVALMEQQLHGE